MIRRWRAGRAVAAVAATTAVITSVVGFGGTADAKEEYTPGAGTALATLVSPALNAGELSVYVKIGDATAGWLDETGRASSSSVAIPLLAAGVGGGGTCGVDSAGPSLALPDPVIVTTASNQNTKSVSAAKPASGQGGMVQSAEAEPGAAGTGKTTFVKYGVAGLAEVSGASATTSVRSNPKTELRTSLSQARVANISLLGGLVQILGGRWDLNQSVQGTDSRSSVRKASGAFTFDGITIDPAALNKVVPLPGLPTKINIPVASPAGAGKAVNAANSILESLGVAIRLPELRIDPKLERQEITPLRLELGGKKFVLAPVLSKLLSSQQVLKLQADLFKFMFDPANCDSLLGLLKPLPPINSQYQSLGGTAPLLVAALSGVVAGGNVALSFGGVITTIDDTYYPPLDFSGPSIKVSGNDISTPAVPGQAPTIRTITKGGKSVAIGNTGKGKCETTSPAGKPGCWLGRGGLAAVLSGGVAVFSLAADEVVRRRKLRLTRNEVVA